MGLGCIVASTLLALVIVGTWALARMELWERERELGIRMAVGCPPTQAVRIILLGSASWALGGALLGAVLGWPLTRSLGAIPWHIAELPLAFAPAASLVVSGICFLAALGPALGAVTLDARRLLRAE